MASAADVDAKNTELQSQAKVVETLEGEVSALRGPYHAKLEELTAAIVQLDKTDHELEALSLEFKAPAAPEA